MTDDAPRTPGRPARWPLALVLGAALAVVAALATAGWWWLSSDGPDGPPRAVIVDQLGLAAKNPGFINEARSTLERAGYDVDYVPSPRVTVDYYRELPEAGYDVVVLRVHAGVIYDGKTPEGQGVFLFTSERYDEVKYVDEQRAGELAIGQVYGVPQQYFGVTPAFIADRMQGDFDGATVIVMGCDGLAYEENGAAFVERGADTVIGWRGLVTSGHTDTATQTLLSAMLDDGLSAGDAVARTMSDVGPDPIYDSQLLLYPSGDEPQARAD
jgi:hypothetical protein